jgi:hypothetical protein
VWSKRHRDLGRTRNQAACRLHAVLCDLVPVVTRRRSPQLRPPRFWSRSRRRVLSPGPAPSSLPSSWLTRPGRGVLGEPEGLPAVAARQPAHQPRDPHGRDHPDPAPAQRRPRVLREEASRGKDAQGSAPVPQAADQRRHLRPSPGRRPAGRRSLRHGPGRATGERPCIQRGRLTPRTPALRASHSRACHHHQARRFGRHTFWPPIQPSGVPGQDRVFPGRCHSAAGEAAGPGGVPGAKPGRTTWRWQRGDGHTRPRGRPGKARTRSRSSTPRSRSHGETDPDPGQNSLLKPRLHRKPRQPLDNNSKEDSFWRILPACLGRPQAVPNWVIGAPTPVASMLSGVGAC